MAICDGCGGLTESVDEVCSSCAEYANARSPVGAYSASALRASYSSAGEYPEPRTDHYSGAGLAEPERTEPEFASLPHFERPFAAEGTVWPDGPELVLSPDAFGPRDVHPSRPERRASERRDVDERHVRDRDQQQRELAPGDQDRTDSPQPQPAVGYARQPDPGLRDPAQHHPAVRDPAPGDPAQQHPAVRDPAPGDPAQHHPAQRDPAPGDPAQHYPAQRDPAQRYPAQRDLAPADPAQRDAAQYGQRAPAASFGSIIGGEPEEQDEPATIPRSGRWIALTAALAVLVVSVAGAVTLVVRHDTARQSARITKPSVTASPSSSAPGSVAPTSQNQLVVDPAAATAPGGAAVAATLNRYFDAINNRDYLVYKRTFIIALRSGISPATFSAGVGATTVSSEQLRSITVIGAGQADAIVTFVSQQASAASAGSPSCTAWSMEFFLGQRASRYLLVAPPQWRKASTISCS